MQSINNSFRKGWLPTAAVVFVLVGAWWIFQPPNSESNGGQEAGRKQAEGGAGELNIAHQDRAAKTEQSSNALSADPSLERTAQNAPQAWSRILVVDREGNPVPDLEIAKYSLNGGWPFFSLENLPAEEPLGITNQLGLLTIPKLRDPAVTLVAINSPWLVVNSSAFGPPYPELMQLQVRRGGSIRGQVIGEHGSLVGASIQAFVSSAFFGRENLGATPLFFDPANSRFARTDSNGRFQVTGLIPCATNLRILADDHAPFRHDFEGPAADEMLDLGTLMLTPGIDVTFQFTSAASLEEGTRLFLDMKGGIFSRGAEGLLLDAQDNVFVPDMLPGKYEWNLERPGAVCATGEFVLTQDTEVVEIQIPATRTLEVKVRTEDGLPITDIALKAYEPGGRRFQIKMDDTFSLSCSEGKRVDIKVKAPGFVSSKRIRVPATENSIEVVLFPLGHLQIQFVGLDDRASLRLGMQPKEDRDLANPLLEPFLEVSLREHSIENHAVLLPEVEPGPSYVIIDLGAGPMSFGPFEIKGSEVTSVEIEVELPREITVVVRDRKTNAPIAGAKIYQANSKTNGFGLSIMKMFGTESPANAISDANGVFTTLAAFSGPSDFSVNAPNYEIQTVRFAAHSPQPYQVKLKALPSVPVRVSFTEGESASNATVRLVSIRSGLPSSLSTVSLDENGEGILTTAPEGKCLPTATFQWNNAVRYRVGFPIQSIRNNRPVELLLAKNPGWLTFEELPQGTGSGLSIRSAHAKREMGTLIQCDTTWWQSVRSPLALTPGPYRITAFQGTHEYFASCTVRSGETTHVIWNDAATGQVVVDLQSSRWTTCQLEILSESGGFAGERRHLYFDRTPEGIVIEDLAEGKYLVRLVAWTDFSGERHKPDWSQRTTVSEQAGIVHFQLDAAAMASILVVDENGAPLERASVKCAAVEGKVITLVDGVTNSDGRCQLALPFGEVVFRINRTGGKQTETRLRHSGEGEITLICPSRE